MGDLVSEDETEETKSVELGFLVSSPSWKLESRFFPSKVGNKPAWLALSEEIPSYNDLLCSSCNNLLIFLCQLYAPVEEKDTCFHRMLYIFVCKTDNCIKSNSNTGFRVYRCQIPRDNKYYPFDPPIEEEQWRSDICTKSFGLNLCNVCGIKSTNRCGNCKNVYYCSKQHQVLDWKEGHKKSCKENGKDLNYKNSLLFPEQEIVTESENDVIAESLEGSNKSTVVGLSDIKGSLQDVDCEEDLTKMAFSEEDKHFFKFRKQIKYAPDQVIRYERNGTPLWITDKNLPAIEECVENCEYCGEKRVFEFQVLPQLLNYLGLNVSQSSLDWGTLVIFTCKNCCDSGKDYKLEYVLKQDMC